MFSTFDCAIKSWRQKEDAWNAILSGFMTGGCLAARSGSNVACAPLCSCLIARWTQVCPRLRHCLWHSPRSVRGRWRPHLTSVQRGKQTTDGSSYVPIPSSLPHLTPFHSACSHDTCISTRRCSVDIPLPRLPVSCSLFLLILMKNTNHGVSCIASILLLWIDSLVMLSYTLIPIYSIFLWPVLNSNL